MSRYPAEYLSWEEFEAGEPCPSCGMPWVDQELWIPRGTARLTPDERERYEAEKTRYARDHGGCGAGRHSMAGALTQHCVSCCPPPPLSPEQRDHLGRLMASQRARRSE